MNEKNAPAPVAAPAPSLLERAFDEMTKPAAPAPEHTLLPCPFCGHQPEEGNLIDSTHPLDREGTLWTTGCLDNEGGCNASTLAGSRQEAIDKWNTRVAHPAPVAAPAPATGKPIAWVVSGPGGGVYHLSTKDGWTVDPVVFEPPSAAPALDAKEENLATMARIGALRCEGGPHSPTGFLLRQLADEFDRLTAAPAPDDARDAPHIGPFRSLVAACNRLSYEAEEYTFDDGMGRGALQDYWDEFEAALERAREVLR